MRKLQILNLFLKKLNEKYFPSGNIPTQLYINKQLVSTTVKAPSKLIAIINKDFTECKIYCFNYPIFQDSILLQKVKSLENYLKINIPLIIEHVVSQRRIVDEAFSKDKIIIGTVW